MARPRRPVAPRGPRERRGPRGAAPACVPGRDRGPPATIDEINAGQVEERRDAAVAQLIDEICAGHAAALGALGQVDDATLATTMPQGFRPGEAAVADMIVRGGPGHDGGHVDQIEAALA
ncbi:MAG: hypothetical protein EXR64_00305 [Dehalococcoidia bacterium]|nr:hypothetical protein [Dehalococcoidia bacterium]